MPRFRTATVTALIEQRDGLQRVETDLGPAYALTDLVGPIAVGDRVVLNTTAIELGLGTGGWHVVHWNLSRDEWESADTGHVVKLRYTSLQLDVDVTPSMDVTPKPVVACSVHSQVPCVAAAFKHASPDASVTYVMTDGGALPIAISNLVASMRDAGLVDRTVTAGHAFGGDVEAVNVASALTADGDLMIVGMGPGVVGTGDALATTAVEVAAILDTASYLGHRPIASLRYSTADARDRHRGVSHHSTTALAMTHSTVEVAVPRGVDVDIERHHVTEVDDVDVPRLLRDRGVHVTAMGRGPDEDPLFFAVAGAAGTLAASLT